ncbi:MAG: hypothetical protein FWE46_00235 [Coriobacteriia bacterium]|nr:hypothetical protein [Coriobacteriia bacterium]MCL2536792.1 hypothetical protein [Coriobacteriia bacterium]
MLEIVTKRGVVAGELCHLVVLKGFWRQLANGLEVREKALLSKTSRSNYVSF